MLSVLLLSSCSTTNNEKTDTTQKVVSEKIQNDPIKIYRFNYESDIQNAIAVFRTKYNDVDITETVFNENNEYKEYSQRLTTELMAGEGPDIIVVPSYFFNSLFKTVDAGVYCDLNPLFSEDNELKYDNFSKAVFDCGIIDTKRYFIPISYTVPAFLSSEAVLSKQGIEINFSNWSSQELDKNVRYFTDHFGKDKFFTDNQQDIIESMILGSGLRLVDYEEKKTYFNTAEFKELLNYIKNIWNTCCPFETETKYRYSYYDMLKEGSLLTICNNLSGGNMLVPTSLWETNSKVYSMFNENVRIIPFPEYSGKKEYAARPTKIAAICSNCSNKKAEVNFIKILLSKEIQTSDSFLRLDGIPVNNSALEELLKKYSNEQTGSERINELDGTIAGIPFNDTFVEGYWDIVNNVKRCNFIDNYIQSLISMYAVMYSEGTCTAEEAVKQLDTKVTLYLNE